MITLIPPDLIPNWIPGEMTVDSSHMGWSGLTLKGYRYAEQEVQIPQMRDYMIVVYKGAQSTMRRRNGGPWQSATVEPGAISLLTRAEQSTWHWDKPIDVKHIYLSHDVLERTALQVFERDPTSLEIDDHVRCVDQSMPQYLKMLEQELSGNGFGENVYVDALRTQITIHLLRNYARIELRNTEKGALGGVLRKRLIEFIEGTLADSIHLDDLAATAGLSAYHFSRKFKIEFGVSPHAFIVERRIERAKSLLRRKSLPLKAVAADCGFADQSHFNRIFRKVVGLTPDEYRKGT